MRSFWTAFHLLTIFPCYARSTLVPEEIGKSTSFFPLVGFCLGLILVLINWLLDPYLASEIVSVLIIAVLILMTRALHLKGLGGTLDGLGVEKHAGFRAMREDQGIRIFGLLAVLVVIALKFRATEVMGDTRSEGLLLAPVLGRWAIVILAYGSEFVDEGGIEQIGMRHVRGFHLVLATVMALAFVIVFAGRIGLWIALWVSLLTLLSRSYLHHRAGGLTGDHFGAVEEISETLTFVLFASL
jgi:adenosylcobinamide-GDP ribazoletransferase